MTQIILLMILMSGSIAGCAFGKKKFEELLPITCSGIVVILFLSGILSILNIGVYFILLLACLSVVLSTLYIQKNKTWKLVLKNFFTPGFVVFTVLYFVLSILIKDMMVCEWDEFSHWADIVKVMVNLNDFGTNPDSGSLFASYTPGVALFQYFVQKIYLLIKPEESFSEWRLYFSYQILFISYLMPFMKKITFKQPLKILLLGSVIWLAPMLIFTNIYSSIYVDAMLGIFAGAALATVFTDETKDWLYDVYICLTISVLVLAKDAGMLFAAFVLIAYIMDSFLECNNKACSFILNKVSILKTVFGILAIILPKVLWTWNIKINQASVSFGNKINIIELVRVLLGMEPENYRSVVLHNYSLAFVSHKIEIGSQLIEIPYMALLIIFIGIAYWFYVKSKEIDPPKATIRKITLCLMVIQSIIFIVGMCVSYMFKFSENEAISLAGFSRYMKIIFHCWWVYLLMLAIDFASRENSKKIRVEIFVFCFCMIVLPWSTIALNVTRQTVDNAFAHRAPYQSLINQIEEITKNDEEPSEITVICQETQGYEQLLFRYALRPHDVDWKYSIGEPFYEGDGFTETITAEEWQERLVSKRDYVALYKINDYFIEEFASVFENADEIMENGLYRVNKETGLLELCVNTQ